MGSIATGELKLEGLEGVMRILSFSFWQEPGKHATARLEALAEEGLAEEPGLSQRWIRVLVGEAADPLFCGRLRWIEQQQVKGNHRLTLELVSGTSLLDQKRKSHSYQDIAMSYGKLLDQAARQAGGMVLYPAGLEERAIGFPKIQYEETDWEFLKRMASHLGLSLYPQVEQPRAGLWVGLPQAEGAKAFDWRHYRIVWDSRYDELGGEKAGNSRDRFISYEVESEGSYGCGQEVTFQGKGLTICSKSCRSEGGELLFTYRLGYPEWAGQRRLTHKKLSGLSLLGEVISREGERLKLKLDIDREHSDWKQEKAYAFLWCPPTGNLMYMMPAQGSRVSLYFPRGEEEGAVAVNCIRREGEAQGRSYRERGLKTEGKELKLYPDCMGVESISGKVMLDDLEGIRISGDKALQIIARGKIRIEGKGIQVEGGKEGIRLYHGGVEERGEEILVAATAQLHLLSRQGEAMWVSLGEKSSLLGYEVEDYSAEGFRFKDDPVQENYDWDAYWSRVAGALVIVGGVTLIAGTGAGILAAGGWAVNATVVMGSAAAGGIIAVGGLAAMDAMSGRLSSAQEYIREALVGSIIGALTGATAQLPTKRLGIVGKNVAEFAIGSGESAAEQQLRKGEIDFREAIGCGILNLILSGVLDNLSREQGVRVKGGEGRVIFFEDELPPEEAERLINFLKNDRKRINYQDIWDIRNSSKVIESGRPTKGYSNFADGMSPEDAARYIANNEKAFFNEFSERARAAGLNSAHIEEAFTAMRTGDYAKMASYFDTSSPVNGAVFWSGNKEGAAAYANSIGGTIMEQTPGGRVFDNWRGLQGMYPEWDTVTDLNQKPIWDALSSQYANGAEGMATYVHPSGYEGKVWLNIEKAILEENNIIIQEVIIDAK